MQLLAMTKLDLANKRVLIREDLNVPIDQGRITNDQRIRAAIPTLQQALKANAKVIVLSHLGDPEEGKYDPQLSLAPVAQALAKYLNQSVPLIKDWHTGINIAPGEIVLCENVRFNKGEKNCDAALSKQLAALCDIFVMDAFATAHRNQASTAGITQYAPHACAGPLLIQEIQALEQAFIKPKSPLLAVIGGSKVSTKLQILLSLAKKVDCLLVGGGIANTFLAAQGVNVGKSLYEKDLIPAVIELLEQNKQNEIPLPTDVVVAEKIAPDAKATVKKLSALQNNDIILDIGPETANHYAELIKAANTIIWNGPVGLFEYNQFATGTKTISHAIAHSQAYSLAGGGDTLAAIDKYNITDAISYISTGGGAFLQFLEGKPLPALTALMQK